MSYRDGTWASRFAALGDEAEGVFLRAQPIGAPERLGWNRPKVALTHMAPRVRHMPDYFTSSGYLVEVVGLGRDGVLKLKVEKWDALKWWNTSGNRVCLFAWNSSTREYAVIPWDTLRNLVAKGRLSGIMAFKQDGNEYYPIRWRWIEDVCIVVPWDPDS